MRADPDAMAEHAGDLVDDGQTQTEAAILIRRTPSPRLNS